MGLDPVSVSIEVEDFALITHLVPAERVRRHLPGRYELQTVSRNGTEMAFVSATCFCNRDFRPTLLGYPRHTFNESTYRTYIRYGGRDAVYFFLRYLGTPLAAGPQRVLDANARRADFDVDVRRTGDGYVGYTCRVTGARGESSFSVEARDAPGPKGPFSSGFEHEQFITYRLDGHFKSSGGFPAHGPVSHERMQAYAGRLRNATLEPWEDLGILAPDEVADPFSVLITPGTTFRLYPPRPALG